MVAPTAGRSIAEVAVNVPLRRLFHYSIPERLVAAIDVGQRVLVPFGKRTATGVCVGFPEAAEVPELKPIREILHPECSFDRHLLELTRWIADYYHAGWGEVLEAALPPPVRAPKAAPPAKWIAAGRPAAALAAEAERMARRARARAAALSFLAAEPGPHPRAAFLERAPASGEVLRRLLGEGWALEVEPPAADPPLFEPVASLEAQPGHHLHAGQEEALAAIEAASAARTFQAILLHGVTGSGKTEVYLRGLRAVLAAGRRGLVLVPEISLTPQTVRRFQEAFPAETVAVLHSMLSPAERREAWRAINSGKARLVIGARSSVFAPAPDLGLIVVDEEHDGSYKQESTPRYNARDVAIVRARLLGIPIVLGSATPTLESAWNARCGKYRLVSMPRRATAHDLPAVSIVPLGPEFYRPDGTGLISDQLDVMVRKALAQREQVLLFLNRRGFATYVHCVRCGLPLKCSRCDITLTYHRRENLLRCHWCGEKQAPPGACPDCGAAPLRRSGVGTEKIAAELARRYPEARAARLDRDTVTTYHSLRETLERFGRRELDILVGTQMVAKGHDFPEVTIVGIINADTGLHFPDFRAAERTFQLITQVAGRAGRGQRSGRVVVQTFVPDHYAIIAAAGGDYDGFLEKELAARKPLGYPPFGRLVKIQLQGPEPEKVAARAEEIAALLRDRAAGCRVLGPAPAPIARVEGRHRYHVLLKSPSAKRLHDLLGAMGSGKARGSSGVDIAVDVDPQGLL